MERLLFDADNAEQWLTERELIVERPIKVRYPDFAVFLISRLKVLVTSSHAD